MRLGIGGSIAIARLNNATASSMCPRNTLALARLTMAEDSVELTVWPVKKYFGSFVFAKLIENSPHHLDHYRIGRLDSS